MLNLIGIPVGNAVSLQQEENWLTVARLLEGVFATKPRAHRAELFRGTDSGVAPVMMSAEATSDHHLSARGPLIEIDGLTQPALAPRFSRTEGRV